MTSKRKGDMLQMSESEFEKLLARAAKEGARRALVDERHRAGLVEDLGDRRGAQHRAADPVTRRLLAGVSH